MRQRSHEELAHLAAVQHGAIHRGQLPEPLADRGAVRWLVTSGRLAARTKDVFVVKGSPETREQQAWIALLEAGPGAALSHRTAIRLLGFPGFDGSGIDVAQRESRDHRTEFGSLHQTSWLPTHHVIEIDGWPVTSLPRTLFDLAGISSPSRRRRGLPYVHEKRVERLVNDALHEHGLTVASLATVVHELGRRGRPGTALMRRLVEEMSEVDGITESDLEDLLLGVLIDHHLPLPAKQVVVGSSFEEIGRVDFLYRKERVVIEADSRKHHGSFRDTERDKWRALDLASSGFITVQVTWWQLRREPGRFARALEALLETRRKLFASSSSDGT